MLLLGGNTVLKEDIEVSVCCLTYNHKNYIRQAIDSFINQNTNFNYEVVIHDDCSNDGTIDILKEYEQKYPNIIKVIYEEKNLYSQGIKMEPMVFKQCKGKYIALCEGDDYWCDENKLQIQYDFMKKNVDYSLVCHDAKLYYEDKKVYKKRNSSYKKSCDCSVEDFILKHGVGGGLPTCSMFFKKQCVEPLPDFFYESSVGDLPLTLYLGLQGKCYYINKVMGVYRVNTPGSWTMKINNQTEEQIIKTQDGFNSLMKNFNEYSNKKYDKEVQMYLLKNDFDLALCLKRFEYLKNEKFKVLYKNSNFKFKLKLFLIRNFSTLFLFLKKVKNARKK